MAQGKHEGKRYRSSVFSWSVLILVLFSYPVYSQISWVQKVSGGGLGNPFCVNPLNDNILYSATGDNNLRISRDRGATWQILSTIPGGSQIKSVAVNATDTNHILVAMEAGPPDKILKSTDNGATWTVTMQKNFYYWGIPLAYLPTSGTDTVYTMANNVIYRSSNFGTSWDSVSSNPFGASNQGWEYCIIRADSPSVLIVGDNATGIWKSYNRGKNWKQVHTAGGEIPALASSPSNPKMIYATRWSGGGGFVRSTDGGETWSYSSQLNGINMWSVSVSTKDPNYVITGTYGPSYSTTGGIYISRDAGATWQRTYLGLSATTNYGTLVLDTLNLFVLQGDGIWRYNYPLAPVGSITLTSPNGGEIWHATSARQITWASSNISNVKIEYSLNNGANWSVIANSVSASSGEYTWIVPDSTSAQALVRVSDSATGTISDQSDASFIIDRVYINLVSPTGGEVWNAGTQYPIQWNSVGVLNVKIELSTDNGASWFELVHSMHASVRTYQWTVPQAHSNFCKIKVTNITEADVFDMSDSAFTIKDTAQFLGSVMLFDNFGNFDTLSFGEKTFATDGLDPAFGEVELSIKPPAGTFDARWSISGTNGTKLDLRDTLSNAHLVNTYTLELQPGASGYPLTLHWNPATFPPDYFTLRDGGTGGELLNIDMFAETTCVISNPSITSVQVVHSLLMSLPLEVNSKWNIISVPMKIDDRSRTALFPTATSNAFEYTKKYHPTDTLAYGKGYWVKFNSAQEMTMWGRARTTDSVDVSEGWNIIGSLTKPVAVSHIVATPPGLLGSMYYGYNNGYFQADTLQPGQGYWVKMKTSGKIILNSSGASVR